ncbi:MAG: hypothetical protein ACLT2T_08160, partial [Bilophila wadsworthia]
MIAMCPVEKRLWRGWGGLRAGRFGEEKEKLFLKRVSFPSPIFSLLQRIQPLLGFGGSGCEGFLVTVVGHI